MKNFILWLATAVVASAGTPKITFDRLVYDFGKTALVETVTGTFTYQNTGDAELKVEQPKPSCGCTVAKLSATTLAPGEKGELVFSLSVGAGSQKMKKEIIVPSNDPTNSHVSLGVRVETKSPFVAEPGGIDFGDVLLKSTTNASVVIRRSDGRKLTVTKLETTGNGLTAKFEPVDDHAVRVTVTLTASGMPRLLSEQVKLTTSDSIGVAHVVFANAWLSGPVKLEPAALSWGMPNPADPKFEDADVILSRQVTITAVSPGQKLVLSQPTSTLPGLKVTLEEVEKGRQYLLDAEFPKRLTGSVQGTITVDSNLPEMPKINIPIEVNVWK